MSARFLNLYMCIAVFFFHLLCGPVICLVNALHLCIHIDTLIHSLHIQKHHLKLPENLDNAAESTIIIKFDALVKRSESCVVSHTQLSPWCV